VARGWQQLAAVALGFLAIAVVGNGVAHRLLAIRPAVISWP